MTGRESTSTAPARPRPRARKGLLVSGAALALVLGLGASMLGGSSDEATAAGPEQSVETAPVVQETLVRSEKHRGKTGFGSPASIGRPAAAQDEVGGTVTWLPDEGTVVDRGQQLWRVDDRPTIAMLGDLPAYRELVVGHRGPDVAQLKDNLRHLGYTGFSDDDRYTSATSRAVSRWQKDVGLPQTGRVGPEQVTVVPGPVRVSARLVDVGAPASEKLVAVTDVHPVVTFEVDPAKQAPPEVGAAATVVRGDGARLAGTVTRVDLPVDGDDQDGEPGEGSTAKVVVSLEDPAALDGLDTSPVDVELDVEERADVLTVPVTALLALAEGGYGVEVGAEERRLVPVETGMFADGRVEVSGELSEGDEVVVPS